MKLSPDFGITGYTDRWTYRPGDAVALHLSADRPTEATVRLHRFRQLVPDGPGLDLLADLVPGITTEARVQPQATRIGSSLEVAGLAATPAFTLAVLVQPTLFSSEGAALVAWATEACGLILTLGASGTLDLHRLTADGGRLRLRLDRALAQGHWSRLVLTADPAAGEVRLVVDADGHRRAVAAALDNDWPAAAAPLRFGAADGGFLGPLAGFAGRMEAPILWSTALPVDDALARLDGFAAGGVPAPADLVAAWDFAQAIDSDRAVDVGANRRDGRFINLPMRAVKGSGWRGVEQSWRHAPRDYAAVHFHGHDLADAGWPEACRLALPDDLESGCYLLEITGDAGRDTLPIFVTATNPGAATGLAWLAPTFTYQAYVNDRCLLHGANPEVLAGRLLTLTAGDCALAAHPEYGLSLYDTHADGSGVAYASRRRPCLTLRHSQRAWQGGLGAGLWNFPADLLILSWLDRAGIAFEIVTDDDLDARGAAALEPYRCVLTGSHPEYHTERSHDALQGWLAAGGRLVYLGGNGFYWRVSTHPAYPEIIELRRAEDGNRSWASEPGEYYHAFDGAYGGLWRRNGRPPQALVGVGYTGQGFLKCHPYRLQPDASDPRAAFLFAEPPEPGALLGDFGLLGGGAAGIEIDRADVGLGTPEHALVLATADGLDDSYVLANEEILVNRPTVIGRLSPLLRADLVFFETAAGGAVLATGSIAWAGSLADPREPNPVTDLTRNAIARFLDPEPFVLPGEAP